MTDTQAVDKSHLLTDLSPYVYGTTRLGDELYLLVAEVDFPSTVDAEAVAPVLAEAAAALGVEASLRPVETDVL